MYCIKSVYMYLPLCHNTFTPLQNAQKLPPHNFKWVDGATVNILAKNPYLFPPPTFWRSRGFPVFRDLIWVKIWKIYNVWREAPKFLHFSL